MSQEVAGVVGTLGLPVALIVFALWFIDRRLWPEVVRALSEWRAIERQRTERDAALVEMLDSISESNKEVASALHQLRTEVCALRNDVAKA